MRLRSENLYRIWVSSGVTSAGNYKDSDLVATRSKDHAQKLLNGLKAGWETIITNASHRVILKHMEPAIAATTADDTLTPHQIKQQLEARKHIASTLNIDDDAAYMIFRLYAEMGEHVVMNYRRCGIAAIPLVVSEEGKNHEVQEEETGRSDPS